MGNREIQHQILYHEWLHVILRCGGRINILVHSLGNLGFWGTGLYGKFFCEYRLDILDRTGQEEGNASGSAVVGTKWGLP